MGDRGFLQSQVRRAKALQDELDAMGVGRPKDPQMLTADVHEVTAYVHEDDDQQYAVIDIRTTEETALAVKVVMNGETVFDGREFQ